MQRRKFTPKQLAAYQRDGFLIAREIFQPRGGRAPQPRAGPHILPAGWQLTGAAGDALRFEEFASTDLEGKPIDVSQRDPASKQLTAQSAAAISAAKILSGSDGWRP